MIDGPTWLPAAGPAVGFLPIALAFIAAEALYVRLAQHGEPRYHAGETAASIGVALGQVAVRIASGSLAALPFLWVYQHRLTTVPLDGVWSWLALFLAVEFCYYWFHRASHTVRWLWASHAVHHSARHFNLSAAIRLGWTGQLSGAFLFFLHTSLDVRLGPLEWVLNTPAHHRVHHASNEACLDRNYGSVLIVFDRLFGTFASAPRSEPLVFGLKDRDTGLNPAVIALGEWWRLIGDAARAPGLAGRLRVLFGRP